ncbi:MAG: glycosyltransferase family 2 protein [Planctomycetes bacterium]|nr:glycosyltransferase family 2 protein [Planctomycetota bacterium]
MTGLSLVIPIHGGGAELARRLPELDVFLREQGIDHEFVLVDDASPDDGLAALAALEGPGCQLIRLAENRGKFGALRAGMAAAQGLVRIFTDADLPYDPRIIPAMVELVERQGFHLVVGDRTLPGSIYRDELGLLRGLATRLFSLFVRLLVTGGLHDTQCGIKAFRADAAEALFAVGREDGFAGDVEILYVALIKNLAIRRLPARLVNQGPSSVRPFRDALRMVASLLRMRRRRYRGDYDSPELDRLADQSYWRD